MIGHVMELPNNRVLWYLGMLVMRVISLAVDLMLYLIYLHGGLGVIATKDFEAMIGSFIRHSMPPQLVLPCLHFMFHQTISVEHQHSMHLTEVIIHQDTGK
jgi:hypothetical protein